jgi:hypothetical protein
MRSVLLAADLVLVRAQPSPLDGWASGEMLKLIAQAQIFRPRLIARFVLDRYGARTLIARTLQSSSPTTILRRSPRVSASASATPTLHAAAGRQRVRLQQAGRMRDRRARFRDREDRGMSRERKRAFVRRPIDAEAWVRAPERPTIDVTPQQRGRIKVTAFKTRADRRRHAAHLFTREFPDSDGDAH